MRRYRFDPTRPEEAGPSTEVETSGEVDSPEEANPLEEAIDELPAGCCGRSHSGCEAIGQSEGEWGRMWWGRMW